MSIGLLVTNGGEISKASHKLWDYRKFICNVVCKLLVIFIGSQCVKTERVNTLPAKPAICSGHYSGHLGVQNTGTRSHARPAGRRNKDENYTPPQQFASALFIRGPSNDSSRFEFNKHLVFDMTYSFLYWPRNLVWDMCIHLVNLSQYFAWRRPSNVRNQRMVSYGIENLKQRKPRERRSLWAYPRLCRVKM